MKIRLSRHGHWQTFQGLTARISSISTSPPLPQPAELYNGPIRTTLRSATLQLRAAIHHSSIRARQQRPRSATVCSTTFAVTNTLMEARTGCSGTSIEQFWTTRLPTFYLILQL